MAEQKIRTRSEVPEEDKWNLKSLYASEKDWEADMELIPQLAAELESYKGKLGESAETLLAALDVNTRLDMIIETAYNYAFLHVAGDAEDAHNQEMSGRAMMAYSAAAAKTSFFIPEIQTIDEAKMNEWMARPDFEVYRIMLSKNLRLKKYILSDKEERILALEAESAQTPDSAFGMLTNVDLEFGKVKTAEGMMPLSQSTWSIFMNDDDRNVRKAAYKKFYKTFDQHKNTLAALYTGSVQHDVFEARVRGYESARQMRLYPDDVPESVYDNLVATIHKNLPTLHRYYEIRRKLLGLDELRHYDVYVPLVKGVKKNTPYAEAVEIIRKALAPLGKEYTDTLCGGLVGGWVDKYENKGKESGAFSAGGYIGDPVIKMNYKESVLRDVYTLAHEGGHSMHSWYSVHSNPFPHYNYTIFEAEVASTFNEQLVFQYLLKNAESEDMRRYLIANRADDILATLFRQTMFAEYEHKAHTLVESGTPLSADVLRGEYRKLLKEYFGPTMKFEKTSDLEGLRIPHFYGAYYVYKYATGISASLALAKRVTVGGDKERDDYFKFLRSGGSRYPIESLKVGGVDMSTAEPVQAACDTFKALVDEMETWVK